MGEDAARQPHAVPRSRLKQAVACAFACAASTAGTQAPVPAPPPNPPAAGSAAPPAEGASPRVLYYEEGGGIITPLPPPRGGARQELPPLPGQDAKTAPPARPAASPKGAVKAAPARPPAPKASASPPPGAATPKAPAPVKVEARKAPPAPAPRPAAPASSPLPDPREEWESKVDKAIAGADYDALAALADAPHAAFSCDRPERAWAVAEALGSANRGARAARILDPLAAGCDTSIEPNGHRRTVFFAGKGGVGKTVASCITAVWLARRGYKTLLLTTDPAAHIGDVLDSPVGDDVTGVRGQPNLWAVKIDPKTAAETYKARILADARERGRPELAIKVMEEELNSPCTEEMTAFDTFIEYASHVEWDAVIFDTAPTGHTLRLLEVPVVWSKQIDIKVFASVDTTAADDVAKQRFEKVILAMISLRIIQGLLSDRSRGVSASLPGRGSP